MYSLFSLGNYTLIGGILLMFIGQLLGIMAMTTVMGWVSYRLSRTNLTIAIGTGINIFYIILAFFVKTPGKLINIILNGIPLSASQVINEMSRFNFDFGLWRPYSILISTAIVFILFGGLLIYKINSSNTF